MIFSGWNFATIRFTIASICARTLRGLSPVFDIRFPFQELSRCPPPLLAPSGTCYRHSIREPACRRSGFVAFPVLNEAIDLSPSSEVEITNAKMGALCEFERFADAGKRGRSILLKIRGMGERAPVNGV